MVKQTKVRYKRIKYKIILTNNGVRKKMLFQSYDRDESINIFHKFIKQNKDVVFPIKKCNVKKIIDCEHELLLVKEIGPDTDTEKITLFNGDKLLLKEIFLIEEKFMMYGYDSNDRKTVFDLVEILTSIKTKSYREIIVVHNKILIYNDDYFDMVICKCESDAKRLNLILFDLLNKNKTYKFIFLGIAKLENMTFLYDLIQEETNWTRIKISRTTTRP